MLNAMRDGAHSKIIKFILFSFLILALCGLVLMDVGGFFRGGVTSTNVATVGGTSIDYTSFDRHVQRILNGQGMNARDAYQVGYVDQILSSETSRLLLGRAALDRGIVVGDDAIAQQIADMVAPMAQANPGVSKADILRNILMNQNISEAEFINSIRQEIANGALQSAIQSAGAAISREELVALYQLRHETRNVDAIILKDSDIKDIPAPQDDVLMAFYEAAKARYAIPETRAFTIAILTDDQVQKTLDISDESLRQEYDSNIAQFTKPERRVLQQAVLTDQAAAEAVKAKVDEGASLKDAVNAQTGGTDAYLGENDFERQGLIQNIAEAAFAAKTGDVIGPLETPLGWHVLVYTKEIAPEITPFEKVKDQLKKDMMQLRLGDAVFEAANTVDDRLAAGEALEDIAKSMGMKITAIGPVRNDGSTPDQKDGMKDFETDRAKILENAFNLTEGESAPVLEISGGRFAALRADKITPLAYKSYDDVKDDIAKGWMADQRSEANRARSQTLQQSIAGGQKSLADAAKELGLSVQSFKALGQDGDAPAPLIRPSIAAIFDGVKNESVMAPVDGGFMVGTVTGIAIPDASKITDKDLKSLSESAQRTGGGELMAVYLSHLQDKYGVKINRRLLDMMYGPERQM